MTILLGYSVWEWLFFIGIAVVVGGLLQGIAGYSPGGCAISLVMGVLGAIAGAWAATQFDLPRLYAISIGGQEIPLVWPILGTILFVIILSLLLQRLLVDL
jgi:uncharacterized membrane protein YeaQ/YmgE (transglycosylase-associated protein family)